MRSSRQLVVTVGLLIACLHYSPVLYAATINAADCTVSSVNTAISSASNGDTVVLPVCSVTWSSVVSVGKSITIQGAGIGQTALTSNGSQLFAITTLSAPSTLLRFTGMSLTVPSTGVSAISMNSSLTVLALRIDHIVFSGGGKTIQTFGNVEGVIDHNTFLNANNAIRIVGDDDASWARPLTMGSANALFIEDNTFTQTNAATMELNEVRYCERGGRDVFRHNTVDAHTYTIYPLIPFDIHPNFGGSVMPQPNNGYNPPGVRGCPIVEVYDNTWLGNTSYRLLYIRAGSQLIYNNTLTLNAGTTNFIELVEEETTNPGLFMPLRTAWPAQDQINNSFYWNNTINGTPITDATVPTASSQPFIQQNRDYFMHAPQATGGKECWVAPAFAGSTTASTCVDHPGRPGGSTTPPTDGSTSTLDTGIMIKVSDGPNAYYPYTAYTYPHPLVTGGSTSNPAPLPPKDLRVQ